LASAKDRIYNFLLADGAIRGSILNGTRMVNEMGANHELGILETLVLGRVYLGAGGLLMQALPGADDTLTGELEELVIRFASIGEVFANGRERAALIQEIS
jgi:molecular chaperone Hsp33